MTMEEGAGEKLRRAGIGALKEPPPCEETLNQKGAMALAERLENYWHKEGYPAARFWAVPVDERFPKIGTYEIYRVASNLVNGMPPRYLPQ